VPIGGRGDRPGPAERLALRPRPAARRQSAATAVGGPRTCATIATKAALLADHYTGLRGSAGARRPAQSGAETALRCDRAVARHEAEDVPPQIKTCAATATHATLIADDHKAYALPIGM